MAASVAPNPLSSESARSGETPEVPWPRIEKFVTQLTHDVRNGLNALELQLTLLGELSADSEMMAEVKSIRGTLAEVTRQLQVIKVQTGAATPHALEYPAADFFEDLQERFARSSAAVSARGAKVAWHIDVGKVLLNIDPELCLGALLELLANARHFGGLEAAADLSATASSPRGVAVTLRQALPQAPAVDPKEWGHTPLLTSRRNAYGLGLFRVRRVMEAQGGTFEASYSALDGILTTVLTLPGPN